MLKMSIGAFKMRCFKMVELTYTKRQIIVLTKRGVPVAKLVPYETPTRSSREGEYERKGGHNERYEGTP